MHGGLPGSPSWSATRAALAGYHHRCGDDGGREPAGSQRLESDVSEVEVVATWAGVVRVVAIRRPVEVLLGGRGRLEEACWFGHRSLLCWAVRPRSGSGGLDGRRRNRKSSESTRLRFRRSRLCGGSDTTFSMGAAYPGSAVRSDCHRPARWNLESIHRRGLHGGRKGTPDGEQDLGMARSVGSWATHDGVCRRPFKREAPVPTVHLTRASSGRRSRAAAEAPYR